MKHQISGPPFVQYFYEVENGKVIAGQDGPGPSGGGAFLCTYEEFRNDQGQAPEIKKFLKETFGQHHLDKVSAYVLSDL